MLLLWDSTSRSSAQCLDTGAGVLQDTLPPYLEGLVPRAAAPAGPGTDSMHEALTSKQQTL